jgi:hypothetical protein
MCIQYLFREIDVLLLLVTSLIKYIDDMIKQPVREPAGDVNEHSAVMQHPSSAPG